jgi:hypothetical protein
MPGTETEILCYWRPGTRVRPPEPVLDPPAHDPELLQLDDGQSSFAFWGWSARIALAADVLFRYITEPPHGDPLYALLVNGRVVGRGGTPTLFFANTVHVSPERELLALGGYGKDSLLHVVHLTEFRSWWLPGLARVSGVDAHGVTAALWPTGRTSYGPRETYSFPPLAEWTQADELPEHHLPSIDYWRRYRL